MAEFVEKALEELLPLFEQLKLVQLFTDEEVDELIKTCRAFEYKINKRTKKTKDFLSYAAFLSEQLEIVNSRRKEMKYAHRYDKIERPLKNKCAFLYRILTHRFKKLEYHEKEINFLHGANMMKQCSQAYTRLLQFYAHIPENFVRAARFEFFDNHSAESARTIVLSGLRKHPQYTPLWATHFEIELQFVAQVLKRRNFFLSNDEKEKQKKPEIQSEPVEGEDDELLKLKVARIVYELAMKTIEEEKEKAKLVHQFLQIARECGEFTHDLVASLEEHLEAFGWDSTDSAMDEMSTVPNEHLFHIDTEAGEGDEGQQTSSKSQTVKARKSVLDGFDPDDPELKELLSKATVTEDYDQRPLDEVLARSQRQQKKARKLERERTAGRQWFGIPATELDDERRRDLELMQMRDALDPKQHYKRPDREVLPKYFQIGRIVESSADFFSARVPKKQRKRTLAEEVMSDYETIARNKKRYSEIVFNRRQAARRGTFRKGGNLSKHSRRKNKQKSH